MKKAAAVCNCCAIGKKDMIHKSLATPRIDVDSETYEVRADGVAPLRTGEGNCRWRSVISCSKTEVMG